MYRCIDIRDYDRVAINMRRAFYLPHAANTRNTHDPPSPFSII